jgi:hypothetical protein
VHDRRHPRLRGGIFARQRHRDVVEHVGCAIFPANILMWQSFPAFDGTKIPDPGAAVVLE